MLFDELIAWTAVQAKLQTTTVLRIVQVLLWHSDGKGQITAYASNNNGCADVASQDLYLAAHSGATSLCDGQAAALPAVASPILKSQRQILCRSLVHLLICTSLIGLEDNCNL